MDTDVHTRAPRYFWVVWIEKTRMSDMMVAFGLLSLADLLATVRMMPLGIREGNAIADAALHAYGTPGFIAYKLLMVGVILSLVAVIDRRRPLTARTVLLAAIGLMGIITLRHLGIMLVLAQHFGLLVL